MTYIRIDYKGNMQPVRKEDIVDFISDDRGNILVVTGEYGRSKSIYESLKVGIPHLKCNQRDLRIETESSRVQIFTKFDWPSYMGLQLTGAYIHRDATLNFLLQIMSKCRLSPELFTSHTPKNSSNIY